MAYYDGYSSGEERHNADIRRAIALSSRNMQPEDSQSNQSSSANRSSGARNSRSNPRPLPPNVAAALLSANLATPSAIAASVSRGSPVRVAAELAAAQAPAHLSSGSSNQQPNRSELADSANATAPLPALAMLDRKKMEEERLARARLRAQGVSILGKRPRPGSTLVEEEQRDANQTRKLKAKESTVKDKGAASIGYFGGESSWTAPVHASPKERKNTKMNEKKHEVIIIDSDSEPETKPIEKPETKTKGKQPVNPTTPRAMPQRSHASNASGSALRFPGGAVRKTWLAGGYDNTNSITIQEVLQKDQLRFAVISSFQWDGEFLLRNIDAARTRVILVAHSEDDAHKSELIANVPNANFRYVFPEKCGYGLMHSKLMLLKYDNYMRIVVPTANFVQYDWGYTGSMENTVFLIDLPIRESPADIWSSGPFAFSLAKFLKLSGFEESFIKSLGKYDFTQADKYRFVYSASGPQDPHDKYYSGLCGLATAIQSLGLATNNPIEVDIASSSIGLLPAEFLNKIYLCLRGYQIAGEQSNQNGIKRYIDTNAEDHVRVHFPSLETVNKSKFGQDAAGTVCLRKSIWHSHGFTQKVFRDCVSTRGNVLMHNKLYYVREKTGRGTKAWAYVGSANLSRNAWGRFSSTRAGVSSIVGANWECGVVFAVNEGQCISQGDDSSVAPLSIFDSVSPVPFDTAEAREYVTTRGLEPWFIG